MKKYISILVLAALCVLSCKRADVSGEDVIQSKKISGLEIRASLPSLTRSVLGSDGLTLNWTEDDKIALWSVPMGTMAEFEATAGSLVSEYGFDPESEILGIITGVETLQRGIATNATVSEIIPVSLGAGETSATFYSAKNARDWFGNLNAPDDDMYWFGALYPVKYQSVTPPQFISWEQFIPKSSFGGTNDYTVQQPFFRVNVPSVQDGKSYWDYQIVYDTGLHDSPGRLAHSIVSAGELLYGDYYLEFNNWTVATSLLEFTMQASDAETYSVKTLEISYECAKFGNTDYYDDYFALSGTAPLQFLNDEEHEVVLHSRFCTPNSWYHHQNDADVWSEMADASKKLTLSFETPIVLSGGQATSSDDLFYAVVIPTMDTQNLTSYGRKPRIRFTAYDVSGKEILGKVLQMGNTYNYKNSRTVYPGIFKGTKYSFDLVLNPVTSPEAGNAGEYDEIVLN